MKSIYNLNQHSTIAIINNHYIFGIDLATLVARDAVSIAMSSSVLAMSSLFCDGIARKEEDRSMRQCVKWRDRIHLASMRCHRNRHRISIPTSR